jgi:GAF domain-containing protein
MSEGTGAVVQPEAPAYQEARSVLDEALARAGSVMEAHEHVCQELYERFGHYSWVGIYVVEGDDLVLSVWSGEEETEHTRIPVGSGICGLAAATGETELVPDVSERPEFIACFPTTKSEVVVPIQGSGPVLGEIDIDSDTLDAFDATDRFFLEDLADRLAEIMERSR